MEKNHRIQILSDYPLDAQSHQSAQIEQNWGKLKLVCIGQMKGQTCVFWFFPTKQGC